MTTLYTAICGAVGFALLAAAALFGEVTRRTLVAAGHREAARLRGELVAGLRATGIALTQAERLTAALATAGPSSRRLPAPVEVVPPSSATWPSPAPTVERDTTPGELDDSDPPSASGRRRAVQYAASEVWPGEESPRVRSVERVPPRTPPGPASPPVTPP